MKILNLLLIISLFAFDNYGQSKEGRGLGWSSPSVVKTDTIQSKVLNASREFCVYLPKGYDMDTDKEYPVLYLLHGLSDTHEAWFKKCQSKPEIDRLIDSGEVQPMIIVSPNAGGVPGKEWNGYFNMPGWNYETFFFDEFIPYIESSYRIKKGREHRAISGLSMGGGGSASYAQHHPEMFSSVYIMSGWLNNEKKNDGNVIATDKMTHLLNAVSERSCIDFVKEANKETAEKLRSLSWYVDIGDDDYLLEQDLVFYMEMRKKGIPCQLRVRDGSHNWIYWHSALKTSLPFASRNFK